MTDNVVPFGGVTRLDISPEVVLKAAMDKLEGVVLAGWTKEGDIYHASSIASGPEALWLLELCKKHLLEIGDQEDE